MATRALVGIIETDAAGNQILTSTYNHYDGYPESLGVALNNHYDEPQSAKRIANQGYISFLDPETGAIDAKNKDRAVKDNIPDDFEEAMYEIHTIADSMGADYVYIYDFDAADWLDSRNESKAMINKFRGSGVADQFTGGYEDDPDSPLGIPGDYDDLSLEENRNEFNTNKPARIESFLRELDDLVDEYHAELYLNDELFAAMGDVKAAAKSEMGNVEIPEIPGFEGTRDALDNIKLNYIEESKEGDYKSKWKNFINEGSYDVATKIKDLMVRLEDEPKDNVGLYLDSVKRDIKRGDVAQYQEMSIDDMVEDYENYIQDKMDS